MRLAAAFAALPFVAATLAYFGFPLFALSARAQLGRTPDGASDAAMAFAAGTFLVAIFVTVLGALPAVSVIQRRGKLTLRQSLMGGVALGNAPFALAVVVIALVHLFAGTPANLGASWYGATGAFRTIAMGTFLGAALGSVFWLVGVRELRART